MIVKRSSLVETQNNMSSGRQKYNQNNMDVDGYHLHRQNSNNPPSKQINSNLQRNSSSNILNVNNNNSSHNLNSENHNSRGNGESKALVIGAELSNLDPSSVDEMERKKEKIMLLSLQRRQQQEEAKARKEHEAMQRREKEREKNEERERRKLEQAARAQAILEAHKLKKAIEEAEREGKTIDKADLMMLKHHQMNTQAPAAKLRTQKSTRPRPKTIHVESGSVDLSEVSSLASRGKKGSSSNLTG